MATHNYRCSSCNLTEEKTCLIAEAEAQVCRKCGGRVEQLFCPPTQIISCPQAFKQTFGEQFGTSSRKDWEAANPHATQDISPSRFRTRRQKDEARWARANKDAAEAEHALRANATLTASPKKKKRSAA